MASTINASTSSGLVNTADTSGVLQLQTASTTAVTIDASQNVGVGTASPSTKLNVQQSSAADANIRLNNTNAGAYAASVNVDALNLSGSRYNSFYSTNNGTYQWSISGGGADSTMAFSTGSSNTERMRIDSSGNVGIGTTAPQQRLGIKTGSNVPQLYLIQDNVANDGWKMFADSSLGYLGFLRTDGGANSEKMRISLNGDVLIGTTSATDGGGLCLNKSYANATIANFYNNIGNLGQVLRTSMTAAANNTSSYSIVCNSGNDRFYVYGNGNVVNSNNSYGTLSDIKLKENIADATPKLDDVLKLQVRNFTLKTEPDQKQIGFIAQEFEEVFPSLIDNTTPPNNSEEVIKSIKTSVLIPILVKAIQEQQALITDLTTRLAALEGAK
jgi:hypothetical protein